jgi:hypothetical protein
MAGAKISGLVGVEDGEEIAGSQLLLVPDTPMLERAWLYRRVSADQNGQFSISGITPGKYRIFAVVPQDNDVEFDPDWLRIHSARGTQVTLDENDTLQLQLKRTSLAQLADDERTAGR